MLGYFNNWNITKLTNNGISSEDFDAINHIALDGISGNMDFLVQTGKYGAMNTIDTKKTGYYVITYVLDTFILQEEKTIEGQGIKSIELAVL